MSDPIRSSLLVDTGIAGPSVSVRGCDWITARIAFHDRLECLRLFFLHLKFSSQPLKSVFPRRQKNISCSLIRANVGLHSCYLHAFLIVDDIDLCGSTKNLLTSDIQHLQFPGHFRSQDLMARDHSHSCTRIEAALDHDLKPSSTGLSTPAERNYSPIINLAVSSFRSL